MNRTWKILSILMILSLLKPLIAQEDFNKWLKKDTEKFSNYLSEEDQKFLQFLKNDWEKFQLQSGIKFDATPKPTVAPIYTPEKENEKVRQPDADIPAKEPKVKEQVKPKEENDEIIEKAKTTPRKKKNEVPKNIQKKLPKDYLKIDFFGEELALPKMKNFNPGSCDKVNPELIDNYWSAISGSNYKDLILRSKEIQNELKLNGWGYYKLLGIIANNIAPNDPNSQNLFVWFLLNKSGYKARIVRTDDQVILSIPSRNQFYGVSFVAGSDEEEKSFLLNVVEARGIPSSFYSYKKDYSGATEYIDLNIIKTPLLNGVTGTKKLHFKYRGSEYNLPVQYDVGLIKFFEKYPLTDLSVYFNSDNSNNFKSGLLTSLQSIVTDKSIPDAANLLLRFVQTAFDYKTDADNFGREKFLFRDETVFYQYSDCEDRSILYSFLVKELLGLDVVGIHLPGHVCTAVKFNSEINGDSIMYKGEKYLICDPTYINAYIGMSMPKHKDSKIENIIELN